MPTALSILDGALAVCGVVVLLAFLASDGRRVYILPNLRANRPFLPEHAALPLLAYFIMYLAVAQVLSPGATAALDAENGLLANVLASLAGGTAAAVIGWRLFRGGLRGFILGSAAWSRSLAWGAGGWLVALPLCWAAERLSTHMIKLVQPDFEPQAHQVMELLQQGGLPTWFPALLWSSAVLFAPLAEELVFRGVLQSAAIQVMKPAAAIMLMALMFGTVHAAQPHAIVPIMVLGVILGYVYERSGGLLAPLVLHGLFNLKNMLYFMVFEGLGPA